MARVARDVLANQGLASLQGERVMLMCSAFFYQGLLVYAGETFAVLEDCEIVYDTAAGGAKSKTPTQPWFVQRSAVESFGVVT